jgi:energy-coupling factor transporter transmembrane protein EcfT
VAVEYQKGNSVLHRLDARTKLLLFAGLTVVSVVVIDPVIIATLFFILYGFGTQAVNRELLNRNLRVLVVIFLTFSMFQILFFTPDHATFLFYLIPFTQWVPVTVEGLLRGAAVFFRFFIVVLSVHLLLYTTPPVDIVLALTRREQQHDLRRLARGGLLLGGFLFATILLVLPAWIERLEPAAQIGAAGGLSLLAGLLLYRVASSGLPPEMGVALSLGFATVGILTQQTQKITDAQKARGYDVQPKNLIRRVQVLVALLIPIFLATLQRSQDISISILARGFDYDINRRTYRRQLVFQSIDYAAIALIVGLTLGGLALNTFGLGNPTEQLIRTLLIFGQEA